MRFNATALWVVTRNPHLYTRSAKPAPYFHPMLGIPLRYPLAIGGLALATVGLFGDLVWHTAFGEEAGVARVIAPFHLLLFAGAAGLASAPLRSAWYAPRFYPSTASFRRLLPPLLALTLVTCVAAFMFQWLNAFLDWTPSVQIGRIPPELAANARVRGTTEFAGAARVLVTNFIFLAPLFLALQRWRLPFGSATLLFVGVSFSMSALTSFDLGATVIAALVGGLVADALIDFFQPDAHETRGYRAMAGLTPLALWTTYFLILRFVYGIDWPFDLWLGTTGLAAISGLLLSFVAIRPGPPQTEITSRRYGTAGSHQERSTQRPDPETGGVGRAYADMAARTVKVTTVDTMTVGPGSINVSAGVSGDQHRPKPSKFTVGEQRRDGATAVVKSVWPQT